MAPMSGQRLTSGHVNDNPRPPPPSSMLATHFASVNGNGNAKALPNFDKESFDLLLEESLGHTEAGEPILGIDIDTNHKLISVLFQAGIDRVSGQKDNPFNARQTGRDDLLVNSCLDVLKLALERSPGVLFVLTTSAGHQSGQGIPLYVWLIPKLLSLLTAGNGSEINVKIREVLEALVTAENLCSKAGPECCTISEFLQACAEAILENLEDGDDFPVVQRSVSLGSNQGAFTRALRKLHIADTTTDESTPSIMISAAFIAALTVTSCRSISLARSPGGSRTSRVRATSQLLGQLESIWQYLVHDLEDGERASGESLVDFFLTLQRLKSVVSENNFGTCKQRCTLLWASSFSDCMEMVYAVAGGPSRDAVKAVILSTLQAATDDTIFYQDLSEILDSRLHVIVEERQLDSELHVSHLPAPFSNPDPKRRNSLCAYLTPQRSRNRHVPS
jgi:hypothetical protein